MTKEQAIELAIKKAVENKRRYNICTSIFKKGEWVVKAERNTNWWGLKSVGIVSPDGTISWDK